MPVEEELLQTMREKGIDGLEQFPSSLNARVSLTLLKAALQTQLFQDFRMTGIVKDCQMPALTTLNTSRHS